MTERIIIAGAGGQGIMLLGHILAEAAMRENKFVTRLASYGAEVRGGTACCMVVISDEEIGSPYIDKADSLIVMNEPSLERFKSRIKAKGLLIINSSLVNPVRNPAQKDDNINISNGVKKEIRKNNCVLKYPFTDIALKLGNIKVANMVALGCYVAKKKIVNKKNIFQVIKRIIPLDKEHLADINKQALQEGMKLKYGQG